jgi:hypothetical protein
MVDAWVGIMSDPKPTRAEAYSAFEAAAQTLDAAKADSKSMCDQAQAFEAQAVELREQARTGIDRALIGYATTLKRLRSVIDLDSYESERASSLIKSAAVMAPLTAGASK